MVVPVPLLVKDHMALVAPGGANISDRSNVVVSVSCVVLLVLLSVVVPFFHVTVKVASPP